MTEPNEFQLNQNIQHATSQQDFPEEKIAKIHKIRKERRRKVKTVCINTCVILEKGVDSVQKKIFYQKFSQFISKSKDIGAKQAGEIAYKYEKSLIQQIKNQTIENSKHEERTQYNAFFLVHTYQPNVPVIMYQPWQNGMAYGMN